MNATTTHDSLLAICLFAAFSNGKKCDAERQEISRYAEEMDADNLAALSRQVLMGKLTLAGVCESLTGSNDRMLAYEMARAICEAGGSIDPEEAEFLTELRRLLGLGENEVILVDEEVDSVALAPLAPALPEAAYVGDLEAKLRNAPLAPALPEGAAPDSGGMILRYAILNGALELLPQTMATIVIIPMQMKMVYRIGKAHGVELDRSNIKEFLGAAGIGLGSQMVEGFARKMVGKFGRKLGGSTAGKVADEATGSAMSFAATYAIGHMADQYYSGGRSMAAGDLKNLVGSLHNKARELHSSYLPQIQERARTLDAATIMSLVKGGTPV